MKTTKLTKPLRTAFLSVILALTLAACAGSANQPSAGPAAITIGLLPDLDSLPFVVAKQKGYFGDNVTLEYFKAPTDRDSAFQSGSLDGCVSDMLALLMLRDGGFGVLAVSKTNGRFGIVASPASCITDIGGLGGKEVGLSLNTIIEYVTDRLAEENGVGAGGIVKVSVPKIPSRLELLASGGIDAAAMPEPYIKAAEEAGMTVLTTSDTSSVKPSLIMLTEAAFEGKRGEMRAFFEAYDKAVDYINSADSAEFMPEAAEELGLPQSALGVALPAYEKYSLPAEEDFYGAMDWLTERDMLSGRYEYGDLVKSVTD